MSYTEQHEQKSWSSSQGNTSYMGNLAVNLSAIFIVDICNDASDRCSDFLDGANMSAQ